jgi:hypothetical protein
MHRTNWAVQAMTIAAMLTVSTTAGAHGQLLGTLGRAAKEGLTQEAQQPAASGSVTSSSTLQQAAARGVAGFTAEQLDRFAAGLATEIELRRALVTELEAMQPRQNHEQCKFQFAMSAAGQRAFAAYNSAVMAYYADPRNARLEAAMKDEHQKFEEATRAACGPAPEDAEAARREKQGEPARKGAEKAGVDARRYALLKELTFPFCSAANRFEAGAAATIPSGAGKSYSYSAGDTALLKPRCGTLLPMLQATL